jgi:hypothetical protein
MVEPDLGMGWTHSYSFSDTGSLVRADRGLLMRSPLFLAAAAVLFGVALDAGAANATCKRFGFTVNDYGKEGPTKDAKDLLDKHIAEWAAEQKIKDYKTGKKDVNCELFLNFVVFDEHTCTASANVCWNDGKGSSTPDAASPDEAEAGIPPTPIRKASLTGHDKKTAAAAKAQPAVAETPPASPPADTAADTPPADAPPAAAEPTSPPPAAEPTKAAETTPPPASPPPAIVETGTLPKDPLSALKKHAAVAPDAVPAPVKSVDAVPDVPPAATAPVKPADKRDPAAASAAATAAAAAAERAAVAAETAAAAAKEAAAAAVAASAASKGGVVPPLDP